MGTIFKPTERKVETLDFGKVVQTIRSENNRGAHQNLTPSEIIETLKYIEMKRANDLALLDGHIFDEQMIGIGKLLESINEKLESLNKLTKISNDYRKQKL
jgi:hypothetical protein